MDLIPFQIDAAWRSEELFSRREWQFQLSSAETYELLATAGALAATNSPITTDGELVGLPLLREKLCEVQYLLEHGSGAVRITGFPAEEVSVDVAKHAFWTIARHLGTPVSQSAGGERLFSVRDAGFADDDARARGPNTRKQLSFHTDRCDVIAFLCYRQAKSGGENQLVSSVAIFNQMLKERPDLVGVLMEPYLYQRHNVDAGNALPYCEQPVFSICDGRFAANLLRVLIERAYAMPDTPDMTKLQREALDYVQQLAELPELNVTFRQNSGDMLLLNNFVTLHRRTEFVDHSEAERKRHLLRVWLSVPNSRPLDPRFAANYGSTIAGAIRGGMIRKASECSHSCSHDPPLMR